MISSTYSNAYLWVYCGYMTYDTIKIKKNKKRQGSCLVKLYTCKAVGSKPKREVAFLV